MTRLDGPAAQVLSPLARDLAEQLAGRYRIEVDAACESILELWRNDHALWEQAEREPDPRRLKRTRAYKRAADRAKKATYSPLRSYKRGDGRLGEAIDALRALDAAGENGARARDAARDAIVASHVSTIERLEDLDAFWRAFFGLVGTPASILDVGCGVHPLLYPFDREGSATTCYLGLDRDRAAVDAVRLWGEKICGGPVRDGRLRARRWSLSDGFGDVVGPAADGRFELALGLKLIPVIARQERSRLHLFRSLPARRFLITGAREAMVKRHSIEKRERASLLAFADAFDFEILGEFDTATELGLLLGTR